ncbi:helix-turn-helix transcriptional regulator [Ruminiclostridium cellobioparum]|uniref:helix-turn-helix transcriptional regulator n=1 Tax=Ruminiclostridium cellobioparum TaxID=29355 RepID=UPI000345A17A
MQISRLFQILYILLEKGTVTANQLAERFEVSVRTIYRDVEALSQAGIPIYASQGKGGGISLSDRFVLKNPCFQNWNRRRFCLVYKVCPW